MDHKHGLLSTPCDRAWAGIAAEMAAQYGVPVRYGWLGLTATVDGRDIGPTGLSALRALLDAAAVVRRAASSS